ncbi:MAG: CaiB/BaiF CoA-transferase family protein [Pseudomonadota bacterium]
MSAGPLSSLKVVEFSGLGPVPLAGQLLADLGADVICVDRVQSDADPTDINRRGKRSIVLNLKTPRDLGIAKRLINRSDVLIEGFRPGVMERLGLGPGACPAHIIYGRMTGWGQTGPNAPTAGHDLTYLAITGALHAMGDPDRPPTPPLNLIADYGGGTMFLIFGILAALIERGISGKGQVVDAAMVDGVPAMMGLIHGFLARGEWCETRGKNWLAGGAPFYRCYACSDGKYIAVGALEPQFYSVVIQKLGLPEHYLTTQMDQQYWAQHSANIATIFSTKPREVWAELFEETDACVAPVLTFAEAAEHPHIKARGTLLHHEGILQAGIAPRFSRSQAQVSKSRAAGADTADILAELGLNPFQGESEGMTEFD